MPSKPNQSSLYAEAHANPRGPGDARPSAMQILEDQGLLSLPNRLTDKIVLITGGTSGLGLEMARVLHLTGARVFMTGRCDATKGDQIAASLHRKSDDRLHPPCFVQMDLSDLKSVRDGIDTFNQRSAHQLNLLICNAGVMSPKEKSLTAQGHEMQFGVNHLAHFLLFRDLQSALIKSSTEDLPSRAIIVSSCAHRGGGLLPNNDYDCKDIKYDPGTTYGQSKTANIYLASEIERRFGERGLHAFSVHPGVIMQTGITRHMSDDHEELERQIADSMPGFRDWTKSIGQGAGSILWAAVAASADDAGGMYLEDCSISQPVAREVSWFQAGRAEWAYDGAAAAQLWQDSERMTDL